MSIYFIISSIISSTYIILILSFFKGWRNIKNFTKGQHAPSVIYASIIIAAKNEENNIHQLFKSLTNQSLDSTSFEIIFINDNSIDNTLKIAQSYQKDIPNLILLDLKESAGKKSAINYGIKHAKGELIITTDADCTHHTKWLESLISFYIEKKPQMIIAPVIMQGNGCFEKMQSLDFFSLIASSAGAAGINQPIMCNAANMAFQKAIYYKLDDPLNVKYRSGDDMFLMLKLKKSKANQIKFIKSNEAVCFTKAKSTFKGFVNQRTRWASKSKGYTDAFLIFTSVIVLLINLNLLINLLLFTIGKISLVYFLIQLFIKSSVDILFLLPTSSFFDQKKLLWYFIPTQLLNIILIPYLAIAGIMSKDKWKDD